MDADAAGPESVPFTDDKKTSYPARNAGGRDAIVVAFDAVAAKSAAKRSRVGPRVAVGLRRVACLAAGAPCPGVRDLLS